MAPEPHLPELNFRIGTKLAIAVGVGVALVAGMVVNQQLGNSSVARQAERGRGEQAAATDLLHAGVVLQRMQIGTREIRLAISENEANKALAVLQSNMNDAVRFLHSALKTGVDPENRARLERILALATDYAAAAADMTAAKKVYAEIDKPLARAQQSRRGNRCADRTSHLGRRRPYVGRHDGGGQAHDRGGA